MARFAGLVARTSQDAQKRTRSRHLRPVPVTQSDVRHPFPPFRSDNLRQHVVDYLEKFGAGEGIRTLDPDLGKVVLYP
jgi:hypothetical protein